MTLERVLKRLALSVLSAGALSCEASPEPEQGCTADLDCKGSRICVDAKCVEGAETIQPQSNPHTPPDEAEKEAACPELAGDFIINDWGELYKMTIKHGAPVFAQNITNTPNISELYFCVSQNKNQIAFSANDFTVSKINSDGSERTQLTTYTGQQSYVACSPKEEIFFFTGAYRKNIYSIYADGTNEDEFFSEFGFVHSFSFSPDAKKTAIAGYPPGEGNVGIYIIDNNENNVMAFINDPNYDVMWPAWSPDGKFMLYVKDYNGNQLYIADLAGNKKLLTEYPQFISPSHAWSPDSSRIAYYDLDEYDAIWIIDKEGKNRKRCLTDEDTGDLIQDFTLINWSN